MVSQICLHVTYRRGFIIIIIFILFFGPLVIEKLSNEKTFRANEMWNLINELRTYQAVNLQASYTGCVACPMGVLIFLQQCTLVVNFEQHRRITLTR